MVLTSPIGEVMEDQILQYYQAVLNINNRAYMAVVHRIWWWRLRSAYHIWTRRWLCSPSLEAHSLEQWGHWKSTVVITAEAALQCLSGSSEFLVSSLFEVRSSFVNQASPFWSVYGISLQVSRFDVAPLEIGFDHVFIPQLWSTLVSFAGLELPVHQVSQHPTFLHSNHVSNPSKLGLDDGSLYAGGLSLIENLQIGDVVLPPDSQDGTEGWHVEKLHFLDMPVIQCPRLVTIEERGKNHGIVDPQFHW